MHVFPRPLDTLTDELPIFVRLGLRPYIFAVLPYEEAQAPALTVRGP
jgi:hypothetical protein